MLSPTILLAIALALSLLANVGLTKAYVAAKQEVAKVQQAYDSFTAQVKVEGEKAQKAADAKAAADRKSKEKADAENAAARLADQRTIAELRRQRDADRNRNFLPPSTPGAGSAEKTCFPRADYLGAYGILVKGLRGLADESTAAVTDLNSAKQWASGPP